MRRCSVCRHPERAAIEEQFLEWGNPRHVAEQYGLHYSAIYRHVRASGLHNHRVGNHVRVLEKIFERAGEATITSHALVQAVRAYDRILERYKRDLFSESLKERVRSAQQRLLAEQRAEQAAYPTVESYTAAAAAATSGLPGTLDYLKTAPASGPASAPDSIPPASHVWSGEPFTVTRPFESNRNLTANKSQADRHQIATENKQKRGKSLKTKGGRLV